MSKSRQLVIIAKLIKQYKKEVFEGTAIGKVGEGIKGIRVYPSFDGFYEWLKEKLVDEVDIKL